MLSTSVCRATRSSPSIPTCPVTASRSALGAARPSSHQRRASSSKTSYPRGSEQAASNTSSSLAEDEKRSNSRLPRRKSKDTSNQAAVKSREEPFANLPAVPSTTHLSLNDVRISSFFSLHRPISVHNPFPTETSNATFNAVFEQRPSSSSSTNKIANVVYTMNPAYFGEGNGQQSSDEKDLRWEILQQSSSNANPQTAKATSSSLEQLVKQFRPFNTPPPPVPFDEPPPPSSSENHPRSSSQQEQQSTSDHVLTHTSSATATSAHQATPSITTTAQLQQPFLDRRLARQAAFDQARFALLRPLIQSGKKRIRGMLLISVKRQRKLKMKKHKYKKLMRRTRTLRKKEGKI